MEMYIYIQILDTDTHIMYNMHMSYTHVKSS